MRFTSPLTSTSGPLRISSRTSLMVCCASSRTSWKFSLSSSLIWCTPRMAWWIASRICRPRSRENSCHLGSSSRSRRAPSSGLPPAPDSSRAAPSAGPAWPAPAPVPAAREAASAAAPSGCAVDAPAPGPVVPPFPASPAFSAGSPAPAASLASRASSSAAASCALIFPSSSIFRIKRRSSFTPWRLLSPGLSGSWSVRIPGLRLEALLAAQPLERFFRRDLAPVQRFQHRPAVHRLGRALHIVPQRPDHVVQPGPHGRVRHAEDPFYFPDVAPGDQEHLDELPLLRGHPAEGAHLELAFQRGAARAAGELGHPELAVTHRAGAHEPPRRHPHSSFGRDCHHLPHIVPRRRDKINI